MTTSRIGFIGLGDMGKPMARRLLDHGWPVMSCAHVRRQAIEELKKVGLVELSSPAEVGRDADVVMTMVRDVQQSHEVILSEQGVLANMQQGKILIIMSTIDPDFCKRVAIQAANQGVYVLDAPVSGFPFRAEQGTLAIMVGGDAEALERCRPILEVMGNLFTCGDIGMGMVTKLANNAIAVGTIALVMEARALARSYGMPVSHLMEIFKDASANSFIVQNWEAIGTMLNNVIALGHKDALTFLEAARNQGLNTPLTEATSHYPWSSLT
jgi:3-hydroxyisobutyrate dehydrogenase